MSNEFEVNYKYIEKIIDQKINASDDQIYSILEKTKKGAVLNLEEIAVLLSVDKRRCIVWNKIFNVAKSLKEKFFGKEISFFAPLYITNECINNCLYCGFRVDNKSLERRSLSINECLEEGVVLDNLGYRKILLVASENPVFAGVEKITEIIETIRAATNIKKIGVNIAPVSTEKFTILSNVGVDYYQVFQETYHKQTYNKLHPSAAKADYQWRLEVMHRAIDAGIKRLGVGVLLGLYNYKFDLLALISHIYSLQKKTNLEFLTISIPRLRPAAGTNVNAIAYPISESEVKMIAAILRLTFPYADLVVSTRERAVLRDETVYFGISCLSAGSKTSPGGYSKKGKEWNKSQFEIDDSRPLDVVIKDIESKGCAAKHE